MTQDFDGKKSPEENLDHHDEKNQNHHDPLHREGSLKESGAFNTKKTAPENGENSIEQPVEKTQDTTEVRDSATEVRDSATEVRDSATEVQDSAIETQDSAIETQDSAAETQDSAAETQDSATEVQDSATETQESSFYASDGSVKHKLKKENLKQGITFMRKERAENKRSGFNVVVTSVMVMLGIQVVVIGALFLFLKVSRPVLFEQIRTGIIFGESGNNFSDNVRRTPVRDIIVEKGQSQVVAIAQKASESVVGIRVTARLSNSWLFGNFESNPEGSGIIIREDGFIVTNDHVIQDALSGETREIAQGSKIEVIFQDQDDIYEAVVIGRDRRSDMAVLKIEANNLPAIEFADSDKVQVGDIAVAIGNPGGLEYIGSVTAGIISGLNRTIPLEDGQELPLIQTDAAINPGNSGGALLNGEGRLIGVNTAKIGGTAFEGLGFAIPSNKVKEVTESLINYQYVRGRPLLGILVEQAYDKEIAAENGLPEGILVSEVSLFTGAYEAGIKSRDIITEFAGIRVKSVQELNSERDQYKPGDVVEVKIYRDGSYITLKVKLSEDKT